MKRFALEENNNSMLLRGMGCKLTGDHVQAEQAMGRHLQCVAHAAAVDSPRASGVAPTPAAGTNDEDQVTAAGSRRMSR